MSTLNSMPRMGVLKAFAEFRQHDRVWIALLKLLLRTTRSFLYSVGYSEHLTSVRVMAHRENVTASRRGS